MTRIHLRIAAVLIVAIVSFGCTSDTAQGPVTPVDPAEMLRANRAKLSPEDQKLVEAQDYCPLMPQMRLGGKGPPIKVKVKDATVFVCCKSCQRQAEEDPEGTLAALKELQSRSKDQKK
jgi:hypothetical protein